LFGITFSLSFDKRTFLIIMLNVADDLRASNGFQPPFSLAVALTVAGVWQVVHPFCFDTELVASSRLAGLSTSNHSNFPSSQLLKSFFSYIYSTSNKKFVKNSLPK
jgi:hypothetical protein